MEKYDVIVLDSVYTSLYTILQFKVDTRVAIE